MTADLRTVLTGALRARERELVRADGGIEACPCIAWLDVDATVTVVLDTLKSVPSALPPGADGAGPAGGAATGAAASAVPPAPPEDHEHLARQILDTAWRVSGRRQRKALRFVGDEIRHVTGGRHDPMPDRVESTLKTKLSRRELDRILERVQYYGLDNTGRRS